MEEKTKLGLDKTEIMTRFEPVQLTQLVASFGTVTIKGDADRPDNFLGACKCAACHKAILLFDSKMVWPLGSSRPQAPTEIPPYFTKDYN